MDTGLAKKKKVLVAPLDWGLGHATRCIPVINALLTNGCEVMLAAEGAQASLLSEAFPGLPILPLPGYGIAYSRRMVWWKILWQVPKIRAAIAAEHTWLQRMIQLHQFDAVISDNRYGLWTNQCPSVIITHQLQPALPAGLGWIQSVSRSVFFKAIERFKECWVPDESADNCGLSGMLGHPPQLPAIPVKYIGWLTRFSKAALQPQHLYKACILLSGPEPQRSILESQLLAECKEWHGPLILIRGLPKAELLPNVPAWIEIHNHLPAKQLEQVMLQSEYLISRGGYSTLMDAFTLGLKCIFIPTPGQTEQEYLCNLLQQQKAAICFSQRDFRLDVALQQADTFDFRPYPAPAASHLNSIIESWLRHI